MARHDRTDPPAPPPAAGGKSIVPEFLEGIVEEALREGGKAVGDARIVQKFAGAFPPWARKVLGFGISAVTSGVKFRNKDLDEAVKELGTGLARGFATVTPAMKQGFAADATAARKALDERRCRAITSNGVVFLHHPDCIKHEGGREVSFAAAMRQAGVGMADCCKLLFEADEAEVERLEQLARDPQKRVKSVADILGMDREAGLILAHELRVIYPDAAAREQVWKKIFQRLDQAGEIMVIRFLAEAKAPAPQAPAAGLDAGLADPFGAGAAAPGADALLDPRAVAVWLELIGLCRANAVVFPDPHGPGGAAGLRKGAQLIRMLARWASDDEIAVVRRKLDSVRELDALIASETKEDLQERIRFLSEKSALQQVRDRFAPAIEAVREAIGPVAGAFAPPVQAVANDLDHLTGNLKGLRDRARARREARRR